MELAYASPCYKLGMFNLPNRATEMIPPGSSCKLCCPGTSTIFAREQPMQYLNITRSAVPPGEKPLAPFLNAGGPWPVTSNKNLVGPSSGKWGFDMCWWPQIWDYISGRNGNQPPNNMRLSRKSLIKKQMFCLFMFTIIVSADDTGPCSRFSLVVLHMTWDLRMNLAKVFWYTWHGSNVFA